MADTLQRRRNAIAQSRQRGTGFTVIHLDINPVRALVRQTGAKGALVGCKWLDQPFQKNIKDVVSRLIMLKKLAFRPSKLFRQARACA